MDKPITGARGSDQEEANRHLALGFYENVMRANYAADPDHTVPVVRSFVDGNYVILHVKIGLKHPVEQELSVMDILRAEDGILVEHWDVEQPIPAKTMHENGMI
jgi:predicted SnoaL-like aldol condensation-catalyzing enzyme